MATATQTLPFEKFTELVGVVADKIEADPTFEPDTVFGLSRMGLWVAAALSKRLGIQSDRVFGLPVSKDEATGLYRLDTTIVTLGSCADLHVLVVDDSSNNGNLTAEVVDIVQDEAHGGTARSAVLLANEAGRQPHYVGETCVGKPADFF